MWGLYFGIILIIEKLFLIKILNKAQEKISNLEKNNKALGKILSIILSAFSHIYAMFLVLIGWVIFAFEDLSKVGVYLSSMFGLNNISFVNSEAIYYLQNYFIIIIVGIICSIPLKNIAIKISNEAEINIKPRLRMTTLYGIAQSLDYLVIGTGNLCEAMVGYTTKWGDNSSDFNPIGNFTVDEVLAIGKYLGVPEKILKKAPNDGLGGKTDEEKMGIRYSQIAEIIETGETEEDAKKEILKRYNASKHKRELVPVYTFERKNYLKDLGEKNKSIL